MDQPAASEQTRFVITPPPVVGLPVEGENVLFPVRRIYCVGRNYADHAREMGHDPDREPPFFFAKPADALVDRRRRFALPARHREPAPRDRAGRGASARAARTSPVGEALDRLGLRRRRRPDPPRPAGRGQEGGQPWDAPRASTTPPRSRLVRRRGIGRRRGPHRLARQRRDPPVGRPRRHDLERAEIIAELSQALSTLAPGDLIFTGTPGWRRRR